MPSLYSSAPKCLIFLFKNVFLVFFFLNFSFCSSVIFFMFLNCFPALSDSFLRIFGTIILNLLDNSWISSSLRLVTGSLLYSFGGDLFPDSSWSLQPYVGVFAFEAAVTSSGHYGLTLVSEDFHICNVWRAHYNMLWPQVYCYRVPNVCMCSNGCRRTWFLLGSDCWGPWHQQLCGPWWMLQEATKAAMAVGSSAAPPDPGARTDSSDGWS